jgi:hypothetical protein
MSIAEHDKSVKMHNSGFVVYDIMGKMVWYSTEAEAVAFAEEVAHIRAADNREQGDCAVYVMRPVKWVSVTIVTLTEEVSGETGRTV